MKKEQLIDIKICKVSFAEAKEIMKRLHDVEVELCKIENDPDRLLFIQIFGLEDKPSAEIDIIMSDVFPSSMNRVCSPNLVKQ